MSRRLSPRRLLVPLGATKCKPSARRCSSHPPKGCPLDAEVTRNRRWRSDEPSGFERRAGRAPRPTGPAGQSSWGWGCDEGLPFAKVVLGGHDHRDACGVFRPCATSTRRDAAVRKGHGLRYAANIEANGRHAVALAAWCHKTLIGETDNRPRRPKRETWRPNITFCKLYAS
jgi:hypothetical protein